MHLRWLLFAASIAIAFSALAANERVALVIGNNAYPTAPLRNAVNDAQDLAQSLKDLGFTVIVRQDTTRKDMVDAVREFGAALEGANVAVFFYAGHAMQFKDRNYLVPVDVVMGSEEDVALFAIEVQQVFDRLDRARTRQNLIILDACRDNPFASSFRVSSSGLAQMSAPSGTLIAYATAPGALAQDGSGRNGVYTKHILAQMRAANIPVELMFKRVREGVERETQGRQVPWDSSSLKGHFAFNAIVERAEAPAPAAPAGPSADMALAMEREFWMSARESNRPEDLRAYLEKYPNGTFAVLARNRLDAATQLAAVSRPAEKLAADTVEKADEKAIVKAVEKPDAKIAAKAAEKPVLPPPAPPRPAAEKPPVIAMVSGQLPGREIAPGVREVTFPDGAIYRGGVQGARMHGKGEYITKGFKYAGEFREGVKEGDGVYVWDNGNRYEGPFVHDAPNGSGKYTFANGDVYTGEMKEGALMGRGAYATGAGDVFEGTFIYGVQEGLGTQRFASGDRYEGEIRNGRAHGKGTWFAADGHRIEGQFVDGAAEGRGIGYLSNGDRYEGEIHRSAFSGRGTYFYKSGLRYEGQMLEGRPSGEGRFWFTDGSHFEGHFDNGLARAKGVLVRDGVPQPAEIVDGQVRLAP